MKNITDKELKRIVRAMQAHRYNGTIANTEGLVEQFLKMCKNNPSKPW